MMLLSLNPVFKAAAENTSLGWLMGLTTVLFMSAFLGWIAWVYLPSNRAGMEEASRMPLEDDDPLPRDPGSLAGGAR